MWRLIHCLFFVFLFAGCNYWPYSREIWIDSRASEDQERFILEAMNEWKEKTGESSFEYRGRISDRSYRYGISDFFDTKNVIYIMDKPIRIKGVLICDDEFGRCRSKRDIFICRKNLVSYYEEESDDEIRLRLKGVTIHELGHFLGLEHSDSIGSIMYKASALGRSIEFDDVEQFHIVKRKKRKMCLFGIFLFFSLVGLILTMVELVLRHVNFAKFGFSKYHFVVSIFSIILFVVCSVPTLLLFFF